MEKKEPFKWADVIGPMQLNKRAEAKVEVFLRDRDMNRKKIEGDGNCLYRTIAYIVYGDENKYADVKRQIF